MSKTIVLDDTTFAALQVAMSIASGGGAATPPPVPTPTPTPTPAPGGYTGPIIQLQTNTVAWQQFQVEAKGILVARLTIPKTVPSSVIGKPINFTGNMTPGFNDWAFTSVPGTWPTPQNPDPVLKTTTTTMVDGPMYHVQIGGTPGSNIPLEQGVSYYLNVKNKSSNPQTVYISIGAILS